MSEKSKRFSFGKVAKLDSDDRKARQPVSPLLKALPLKKGVRVLDLGAGTGYYSIPVAKKILEKGGGSLVAADVEPRMLEILSERSEKAGVSQVVSTLVTREQDGPNLPLEDGSFDVVLVVNLLHELESMGSYLKDIHRVLRVGGHLVAVDWAPVDEPLWGPAQDHRLPMEEIVKPLEEAGFEKGETRDIYEDFHTIFARKLNKLSPFEASVIDAAGTERPFSGRYVHHKESGVYSCRRCESELFRSDSKFDSRSGWPSFDDCIDEAILERPDADGSRTEILCASCEAHLGHVFQGEGFTDKDVRHCVNSVSLGFLREETEHKSAVFAGGCFWGVEYYFNRNPGVIQVSPGYAGGQKEFPTYEEVCAGTTGHIEVVRIIYDPDKTSYEDLARLFFEIHDPTQLDGQGPDLGEQYLSAVFTSDDEEKRILGGLIKDLEGRGYEVATKILPEATFWEAEDYHHAHYEKRGTTPYCHHRVKRFG